MAIPQYNPHVSVDCVLIGFNGEKLHVLLVQKTGTARSTLKPGHMKLPGRMIYADEDLDEAAADVLRTMTGIKKSGLQQFKTFSDPLRTSNEEDRKWLEQQVDIPIGRVITTAYISALRIATSLRTFSTAFNACWWPVDSLPKLIFDHNRIVDDALLYLRQHVHFNPATLFKLLPPKFTAQQLRKLYETINLKQIDIRNFHKKMASMPFIEALDEKETHVAHRAARYYRFDKKAYKKLYQNT